MKYTFLFTIAIIGIIACNNSDQNKTATSTDTPEEQVRSRIVYVDQDTLLEKYELYQTNKTELETESKKVENTISSKLQAFQRKVEKFQNKVIQTQQTASSIAPIELQKLEQKFAKEQEALAKEEQSLVQQRESAALDFEKRIIDLQIELKGKVDEYLEELAEEKGYDLVLIKGNGGGVLYGNKALDITDSVVTELNKRYQESKE
jgi:outer membrane protein